MNSFVTWIIDPQTIKALATVAALIFAAYLFVLLLWYLPGWLAQALKQRSSMTWGEMLQTGAVGQIADWFIWRFTFFGAAAVIFAAAAAWIEGGYALGTRVLGLSILLGAASTCSGWLLGLLFGVPRTLARGTANNPPPPAPSAPPAAGQAQPAPASSPPAASGVNTNLEDISDWLTKTIVGVGLTQLFSVPHFLWTKAGQLNDSGFGWTGHGQLLALGVFVYFATGGFWLGYVGTRTVLTLLLNMIGNAPPANVSTFTSDDDTKKLESYLLAADKKSFDPAKETAVYAAMKAAGVPDMTVSSLVYGLAFAKERANVVKQLNI